MEQRINKEIPEEIDFTNNSAHFPITSTSYSKELTSLIEAMLHRDYRERPSAAELLILVKDWPKNDLDSSNFEEVNVDIKTSAFTTEEDN